MKKSIFISMFLFFSIIFSGDLLFSTDTTVKKSKRKEASLGISTILSDGKIAGMISLGMLVAKVFEFELDAGVASVDTVFQVILA